MFQSRKTTQQTVAEGFKGFELSSERHSRHLTDGERDIDTFYPPGKNTSLYPPYPSMLATQNSSDNLASVERDSATSLGLHSSNVTLQNPRIAAQRKALSHKRLDAENTYQEVYQEYLKNTRIPRSEIAKRHKCSASTVSRIIKQQGRYGISNRQRTTASGKSRQFKHKKNAQSPAISPSDPVPFAHAAMIESASSSINGSTSTDNSQVCSEDSPETSNKEELGDMTFVNNDTTSATSFCSLDDNVQNSPPTLDAIIPDGESETLSYFARMEETNMLTPYSDLDASHAASAVKTNERLFSTKPYANSQLESVLGDHNFGEQLCCVSTRPDKDLGPSRYNYLTSTKMSNNSILRGDSFESEPTPISNRVLQPSGPSHEEIDTVEQTINFEKLSADEKIIRGIEMIVKGALQKFSEGAFEKTLEHDVDAIN